MEACTRWTTRHSASSEGLDLFSYLNVTTTSKFSLFLHHHLRVIKPRIKADEVISNTKMLKREVNRE
uniref:Uncharacterized protein n=1 Tax=Salix viminalis TaxID=40686 RepID=A0A6N2KNA2_SALVM